MYSTSFVSSQPIDSAILVMGEVKHRGMLGAMEEIQKGTSHLTGENLILFTMAYRICNSLKPISSTLVGDGP